MVTNDIRESRISTKKAVEEEEAAFAMTKLISTQLYGVNARDPLSLILVTALLALISFLACLLAARRASTSIPPSLCAPTN